MGRTLAVAESSQPKQRGPGRPFAKGRSPNPGGRPKGLRLAIQQATRNGEDLNLLAHAETLARNAKAYAKAQESHRDRDVTPERYRFRRVIPRPR
jgi:hypothetical protein